MPKSLKVEDFGKYQGKQLVEVEISDLVPLPPPYDNLDEQPEWKQISEEQKSHIVCNLDGVSATSLPKPKDEAEEREIVAKFRALKERCDPTGMLQTDLSRRLGVT